MKVINQYVVFLRGDYQILFECAEGFFMSYTGITGESNMRIEFISPEQAEELIKASNDNEKR